MQSIHCIKVHLQLKEIWHKWETLSAQKQVSEAWSHWVHCCSGFIRVGAQVLVFTSTLWSDMRSAEGSHCCGVYLYIQLPDASLCENIMSLTENPAGISLRSHYQLQSTNINVCAQRPEMWVMKVVNTLQLLHPLVTLRKHVIQSRRSSLHQNTNRLFK